MKTFEEFLSERAMSTKAVELRDDDALFRYIRRNELEKAKELLDSGVNPDTLDEDTQRTPLFYANDFDSSHLLLKYGADINHKDGDNKTPILFHRSKAIIPYLDFMRKNGADLFAMDKRNHTLLDVYDANTILKYFIDNNITNEFKSPIEDLNRADGVDLDILKRATEMGYEFNLQSMLYDTTIPMDLLEYVLQHTKVDQKAFDKWYNKYGVSKETIELFLANGYKLFKKHILRPGTKQLATPQSRYFQTHLDKQEKLKNKDNTILFDLINRGDTKTLEELLSEGKEFFEVFKDDTNPLMHSISKGKKAIALLLIQNGINIKSTSKNGFGALVYAVRKGYTDIVEALLKAKANPNTKAKDKTTPLMWASFLGDPHLDIVKLLVENKARVNEVAKESTALNFAYKSRNNSDEVVKYLESKGAKEFEEL